MPNRNDTSVVGVLIRTAFLTIVLFVIASGCSKRQSIAPAPPVPPSAPTGYSSTGSPFVQIDPLTAVAPNLPTHIGAGSAGIFFVQETDDGNDVVYRIDEFDVARQTDLTSSAVGMAMGRKDVTGNFQGVAVAGDTIYFYFAGSQNRAFISCVGRWKPSGKIEILADDHQLGDISGAAETLSISRGEMVQSGRLVWLWLHSIDGSSFVQIDTSAPQTKPLLQRRFQKPVSDFMPPDLTHENYGAGAGPDGDLLITDFWLGALWQITPVGIVRQLHLLTGLPKEMSNPAVDDQNRIFIFATGHDMIVQRVESQSPEPMEYTAFPAFLIFTDQKITSFARDTLRIPSPFDVDNLHLKTFCPVADGSGWIAYDSQAGELFRVHVVRP